METYITVQNIKAEPCSKFEYLQKYNDSNIRRPNIDEDGFLITWFDKRHSWEPISFFDKRYMKIREDQIFPALHLLKYVLIEIIKHMKKDEK